MANSQRAPFQFGGTCPPIPDIDDITVEVADLPDFCKFDRTVSFISVDPIPPPDPDPPLEFECPCPKSASPFVSFKTSSDCCNWTLHLDYQALASVACSPSFASCDCDECPEGDPYCCGSYIIYKNGKEILRWHCQDIPKGGSKTKSYTDGLGCAHTTLITRPISGGSISCQAYVYGEDCELTGSVERGVTGSCPPIDICVYCGGSASEEVIKRDGECTTLVTGFDIEGAKPGEIDVEKLCKDCKVKHNKGGGGCGETITVGGGSPIYVRDGMITGATLRQRGPGRIELLISKCNKGSNISNIYAGAWNFIHQTCNCDSQGDDNNSSSGGTGGGAGTGGGGGS